MLCPPCRGDRVKDMGPDLTYDHQDHGAVCATCSRRFEGGMSTGIVIVSGETQHANGYWRPSTALEAMNDAIRGL